MNTLGTNPHVSMAIRLLQRGTTRGAYVSAWGASGSNWCRPAARVQSFAIWSASSSPVRPPTRWRLTALASCQAWRPMVCRTGCKQCGPLALFSSEAPQGEGKGRGEGAEEARKVMVRKGHVERVKVVIKEYGTVAVVFHTAISLFSLGTCYLLVSNGLDIEKVLAYFNVQTTSISKGASTFTLAYIFHKVLLPLRATITVVSVPVIVRQLRLRGWMKGPAKQSS